MSERILIAGAGLVGSLLAHLLAKRGYTVEVFERRPDPRQAGYAGGRSINLAMSVRGWEALEQAGLAADVRRYALPMRGRMMHDTQGTLNFQPYGQEGQAIYAVSRGALNLAILHALDRHPHVHLHFGWRCTDMDLSTRTATFEHTHSGQVRTATGDVVFGADGAYSALRAAMQRTDRFDYSQQYIEHGYKELIIPPTADGHFAMDPEALHIWPRKSYMLIALPNPDRSFTATLFFPFEGHPSFRTVTNGPEAIQFFGEIFPDVVPLVPDLAAQYDQNPVSSLVTVRCAPWVHGKTALIGDAAHAIVPFYGQGMNCGFEDCRILDQLIGLYAGDWDQILPAFQQARIPNANAVADLALQNFVEMRDLVADPTFILRKKIEAHLHRQYPTHWTPLYSLVTFSHTPYAEALAAGRRQDELMARVMALPDIAENWQNLDYPSLLGFGR